MIPVTPQSEPPNFDRDVRTPGHQFLMRVPHPTSKQFKRFNYWTAVSDQLYRAYHQICAYSAVFIPPLTGSDTVEHFTPRSLQPSLAYEWSNYRLVCSRLNGKKGDNTDVLDPFRVGNDWFILDFPSLTVKANPTIGPWEQTQVNQTISRLGLNDEECIEARFHWLDCFCDSNDFHFLTEHSPFVAHELERQDLVPIIAQMMRAH